MNELTLRVLQIVRDEIERSGEARNLAIEGYKQQRIDAELWHLYRSGYVNAVDAKETDDPEGIIITNLTSAGYNILETSTKKDGTEESKSSSPWKSLFDVQKLGHEAVDQIRKKAVQGIILAVLAILAIGWGVFNASGFWYCAINDDPLRCEN